MKRNHRWIIFAPVALIALFSTVGNAQPIQGLNTTYYAIDEIPPLQSTTEYEQCGSELENNINRSYDGEPFEDCTGDLFMVHMTGFITIPEHDTIEFWLASDDGGEITIGNNTWGSWTDQGCSAWQSGELELNAGVLPLELWMYENGGATCIMLAWKIDNNDWEIVPEWAFTTESTPQTTTSTTTALTTTVPVTEPSTTTLQETSTSSVVNSTSTIYLEQQTTTSESTTTTTPPPQEPAPTPPQTFEEPVQVPTGTTTAPPPQEDTEVVEPEETPTEEETPTTPEPASPTTNETYPDPTDPEPTPDTLPDTPQAVLSDEQLETILTDNPTTEALLEALTDLNPEQVTQIVEALLADTPTEQQATALASSPEVLAVITTDQAQQIFEALNVTELDNTQTEALIAAVQTASEEIRAIFEDTIDIFKTGLDTYVPVGSNIPVSQRRTLIAITAGITLAAAGTRMRRS